jgi:hypothetical protein
MRLYLDEIATEITPGRSRHSPPRSGRVAMVPRLKVPSNISLLQVPPRAPELNSQENPGSSCGRTGCQIVSSRCINRRVDGGLELPLKLVQARLGHASIQMTADRYGHLFPRGDDGGELTAAEKMFLRRVPRFTAVELAGQSQVPRAPWRWRPRRRRPRCCKYPPRRA